MNNKEHLVGIVVGLILGSLISLGLISTSNELQAQDNYQPLTQEQIEELNSKIKVSYFETDDAGNTIYVLPIAEYNWVLEQREALQRIEAKIDSLIINEPVTQPSGININTASYEQLLTIGGIGPVKAGAIITARDVPVFTPFTDWTNLQSRVSGIGPSTLADIQASGATLGE